MLNTDKKKKMEEEEEEEEGVHVLVLLDIVRFKTQGAAWTVRYVDYGLVWYRRKVLRPGALNAWV